jgi:hypothetical protein
MSSSSRHSRSPIRRAGRRSLKTAGVVVAFLAGAARLPTPAIAARAMPATVSDLATRTKLITGSFCLANLPRGSVRPLPESQSDGDGVWWHVKIEMTGRASVRGAKPRAFIYSEEPTGDGGLVECRDTMGGNVRTLLAGNLNSLEVDAWYMPESAGKPARWQFPYDPAAKPSFDAELGGVVASFDTLYGGSLDPKGRLVWMRNSSRTLFRKEGRSGTFDLEMVDIELRSPRVRFEDGYELPPTTLVAESKNDARHPDKGHVTFRMNVADAALTFRKGELYSKGRIPLRPGKLELDGAMFAIHSGSVGRLSLLGRDGADPEVVFQDVALMADSVTHSEPRVSAVPQGVVSIARAAGHTGQARDQATAAGIVLEELALAASSIRAGGTATAPGLAGSGTIQIKRLAQDTLTDARLKLDAPVLPELGRALGELESQELNLSATGPKKAPLLNGDLAVGKARLGGLALAAAAGLKALFAIETLPDRSWRANFDSSGLPSQGHWEWREPGGGLVLVDGAIDRLELHGHVDLLDSGWSVTVRPGGLDLGASGQVARKEVFLGTTPRFAAGAKIGLKSETGFTVSAAGASGSCDMASGVIVLDNARLAFQDPTRRFTLDTPMTMSADTTWRYDFATGTVGLVRGHASITRFGASAPDPKTPVELGDLKLLAPSLHAQSLDLEALAGVGTVKLVGLAFTAGRVEHTGDPYLSLDLSTGLELPLVEASLAQDARGALQLVSARAENLALTAQNAVFRSKDGFEVGGRTAQLEARAIGTGFVEDAHLRIDDGSVLLQLKDGSGQFGVKTAVESFDTTLSGTKGHVAGSGHLILRNVDASYRGSFAVDPRCTAPGDRWKLKVHAALGRIDLHAQFQDSSVVGSGQVANARFAIEDDGPSECNFDEEHSIKDEKKIIFDYPCGIDWSGIKMCRAEKTIGYEIPFSIHWVASLSKLNVSGRIGVTDVSIRGRDGIQFCTDDYHLDPPLILASYAPGIRRDPHLPIVSDIVHEALKAVATSFESSFANVLGFSASGATFIKDVLGLRAPICT